MRYWFSILIVVWTTFAVAAEDIATAKLGWTDWMASANLDEARIASHEQLLYPESVEGRLHEGKVQYRARFSGYPPNMNYYYAHWGLSEGWFDKYNEDLTRQGYVMTSHSTFTSHAGADIHQATWMMFGEVPSEYSPQELVQFWFLMAGERIIELLVALAVIAILALRIMLIRLREAQREREEADRRAMAGSNMAIDPVKR